MEEKLVKNFHEFCLANFDDDGGLLFGTYAVTCSDDDAFNDNKINVQDVYSAGKSF